MSNSYYEKGANHYDHHKELHIDTVNGGDIGKLISAFFKDDAEDAVVVEETPKMFNDDTCQMCTTPASPRNITPNSSPFTPVVIDASKAPQVIILLRQLMEGKTKPKDVLMPVRAAMDAGVIRRPTWEEFYKEFGSYRLKSKTSFSDYTNPDKSPYTGADFQMMKEKFSQLMSEGQ